MNIELIFSLSAFLVSIVSLLWTIYNSLKQKQEQDLTNNLQAISELERTLGDMPAAFRIHGISVEEIEKTGLSPKEFAYIISSFTLGGIYYRHHKIEYKTFPKNSYRYKMCESLEVRKAWPLIDRMMSPSIYKDKISNTIKLISEPHALSVLHNVNSKR